MTNKANIADKIDIKILIAEERTSELEKMVEELSTCGELQTATNEEETLKKYAEFMPDVIVFSDKIAGDNFNSFVQKLGQKCQRALKIVISNDFNNIEIILDAIEKNLVDKYLRSPLNYSELRNNLVTKYFKTSISALKNEEKVSIYKKLGTIFDKVHESEAIKKQAETQLAEVGKIKEESILKVKELVGEIKKDQLKLTTMEETVHSLHKNQEKLNESITQKNKIIEELQQEKEKLQDSLNEIEAVSDSEKNAIVSISEDFSIIKNINDENSAASYNNDYAVLLVDDEKEILRGLERLLSKKFKIYTAINAENAIQVFNEHPDIKLVFTDQMMPGKTGIELAGDLHKLNSLIPINLLTGYAEVDTAIKAINTGNIKKFFSKPISGVELESEIIKGFNEYSEDKVKNDLVTGAKNLVVNKIKKLSLKSRELEHQNQKFIVEVSKLRTENDLLQKDVDQLRTMVEEMKVGVEKERNNMLKEMHAEKEKFEQEMQLKKERAEKEIEFLKKENKEEVEKQKKILDEEKVKALAEIEVLRQKNQAEINILREKSSRELEAVQKQFMEEKERTVREQQEYKEKLQRDFAEEEQKARAEIYRIKNSAEEERRTAKAKLDQELQIIKTKSEEENDRLRSTITRDLDLYTAQAEKEISKLKDEVSKSTRLLKEKEDQLRSIENASNKFEEEYSLIVKEKNQAVKKLSEIAEKYEMVTQSRESLLSEIEQLKGSGE
ncbi:MAG: response regulator [Oligoflexia bacterium]|nr:response regulator [Oligoflexia bacterium]